MARVPIITAPSIGAAPISRERFRPADNDGGVLGGLAKGIAGVAGELMDYAHVQSVIKKKEDETGAKELDNDYVAGAQKIRASYLATNGLNAKDSRPAVDQSLADLRDSVLSRAGSPRMKHLVDQVIGTRQAGLQGEFETHYLGEVEKADTAASISRQGLAGEEAAATTDPAARRLNIETGLHEIATRNAKLGFGEDVTKADQLKFESGVHASIVTSKIMADDIDGALAYRAENKDRLTAGDESRIDSMLKAPLERRETTGDADRLMGAATKDGGASFSYNDPLHGAGRAPVPGGQFNAARDYGGHQGADIPAPLGSPIYATGPGTATISHSTKGGTIVTVDHGDGVVSKYEHLGKVNIQNGDAVTPDTVIGAVGMTGRTTGPHLHFEIRRNGKPVDPEGVIGQVQQAPQRHDLNSLLAGVDRVAATEQWTPERRDRAKDEVRRRVGTDEQLVARQEQDAERRAADVVASLGAGGLKSTGQIPPDVWAALPGTAKVQYQSLAKANNERPEIKPYGEAFVRLEVMANSEPDKFKRIDIETVRPYLTRGEFARFSGDQAKMRATPEKPSALASIRAEIAETIRAYGEPVGLRLKAGQRPEELDQYSRVSDAMRTYLDRATDGGKRPPTDDELKKAFDNATMNVVVKGAGWLGGDVTKRRYEVPNGATGVAVPIPNPVRARIAGALKATRGDAPDSEIARIYMENKGRPGFWD